MGVLSYALLPHRGPWGVQTVAQGYLLNQPPIVTQGLLPEGSFARTTAENVVIDTIKSAEDGVGFVLRLYEAVGKETATALKLRLPADLSVCDLMENPLGEADGEHLLFTPFEIKTIRAIPREGRLS